MVIMHSINAAMLAAAVVVRVSRTFIDCLLICDTLLIGCHVKSSFQFRLQGLRSVRVSFGLNPCCHFSFCIRLSP